MSQSGLDGSIIELSKTKAAGNYFFPVLAVFPLIVTFF